MAAESAIWRTDVGADICAHGVHMNSAEQAGTPASLLGRPRGRKVQVCQDICVSGLIDSNGGNGYSVAQSSGGADGGLSGSGRRKRRRKESKE